MRTIRGVDDAQRLKIIEEYLAGSSKYSLLKKYKLRDVYCISKWMLTFGIEDPGKGSVPEGIMRYKESEKNNTDEVKALKAELKAVRLELARERMRADVNETIVDLAEKNLKINIRKKFDTK